MNSNGRRSMVCGGARRHVRGYGMHVGWSAVGTESRGGARRLSPTWRAADHRRDGGVALYVGCVNAREWSDCLGRGQSRWNDWLLSASLVVGVVKDPAGHVDAAVDGSPRTAGVGLPWGYGVGGAVLAGRRDGWGRGMTSAASGWRVGRSWLRSCGGRGRKW